MNLRQQVINTCISCICLLAFTFQLKGQCISLGGAITQITSDQDTLYALQTDQSIITYSNNVWKKIPASIQALDIAAFNNRLYFVGSDSKIYQYKASAISHVPGNINAKRMCIDNNGDIWALATDSLIYYSNGIDGVWKTFNPALKALEIAVFNSTPYFIGKDQIVYKASTSSSQPLGNLQAIKISIDRLSGLIWVLNTNQKISVYTINGWLDYPNSCTGKDITIQKGKPYICGLDNQLYRGNAGN